MVLRISLGFSCQTRYSIDQLFGDHRRNPFDFNVTTRSAVLEALATEGTNFRHDAGTASVCAIRQAGMRRIRSNGVFFWHDYPRDGLEMKPGWEAEIPRVNQKYAYLWPRFLNTLRDASMPKLLICANTQTNLIMFLDSDAEFQENFGLDLEFVTKLQETLTGVGARNYSLLLINRHILQAHRIARHAGQLPGVKSRFWGATPWPSDTMLAAATLISRLPPEEACDRLMRLEGEWGDHVIRRIGDDLAYVYFRRPDGGLAPRGEITALEDGYLLVMHRSKPMTAILDGQKLVFSNGSRWERSEKHAS